MNIRIKYEYVGNPDMLMIHTDYKFIKTIHCFEVRMGQQITLPEEQKEILDGLMAIHGIVSCGFESYTITIEKGTVFEWKEILPKVENAIKVWIGV